MSDEGPAQLFRDMAARIERNEPEEFAGAILIVPPPGEDDQPAEAIEILVIDPARGEAHFWHLAQKMIEIGVGKWQAAVSTPSPGHYR